MIKTLLLTHFVLVEKTEIHFGPQLNIITGETGAGKTAILEALALALGARADAAYIRQGQERATVEATFDLSKSKKVQEWLEEAGIAFIPDEDLIIRREIAREGKNRAFINCQLVSLPFLQKIGSALVDFIGAESIQKLRTTDFQRSLVDTFGSLESDLHQFRQAFEKEKALVHQCDELQTQLRESPHLIPLLKEKLQEIESIALQEGEDESLFAKYQRLAKEETMSEKLKELLDLFSETPSCLFSTLQRIQKTAESLNKQDSTLSEATLLLQQAQIALKEAHFHYQTRFTNSENDPKEFAYLENRLSSIARLKKKYGQTVHEIHSYAEKIKAQLTSLENSSIALQEKEIELQDAQKETLERAEKLTQSRKESAKQLGPILSSLLQMLNMSKAVVYIEIAPHTRTINGGDLVEIYLKANPGEEAARVSEHVSSGELSRLFLALTLILAEKNKIPTLLFDEIDANVGGKTASLIGERLAELSQTCQILCITHFPQVAAKAHQHICVQKEESEGRTLTTFHTLSAKEREKELVRMVGGEKSYLNVVLLLFLFLLCSSFALITDYSFVDKEHVAHIDAEFRHVGKAKFYSPKSVEGSHQSYSDGHTNLYLSHSIGDQNALSGKIGYSFLEFAWAKNPRFRGDDYHFATASLGWITTSIKRWRWILSTALSVDAQSFDFGKTGVYYGLAWGRFACLPNFGLHVGWFGYTGVKNGYQLPILGFDWHINSHWQINAIFPIDASLRYHFNECWSLYVQASSFGRPYRFPIRAKEGIDRYRNGIFEVFSTGVELNLKYQLAQAFSAIAGGGWNFGGWILIKDHNNHHGRYYKFDGAPYAQGKLTFTF